MESRNDWQDYRCQVGELFFFGFTNFLAKALSAFGMIISEGASTKINR